MRNGIGFFSAARLYPEVSCLEESNMTKKAETTTFNNGLFERMQDMNRSWLERLREIREIEADFGAKLLTAKSPSEATTICNEWMAKRLETVASEQQTFTTAWLELVWDATKLTSAMSIEASSGQNMQKTL
jgi:hypothetical protein